LEVGGCLAMPVRPLVRYVCVRVGEERAERRWILSRTLALEAPSPAVGGVV
jgi:hypothetical protein